MPSSPSAKRQHVVDTAYSLFKRDGFHATGIDRIIAEANIAKMTMYRHFPAKDELIVAVLEHRAARFERQLDRLAATAETAEAKILTILDWHERWFRDPDFHGCLFAHALAEFGDPDHPVFKAASRQKNGLRARLRAILEEEMPPERAEGVATALLMLIEGATLLAQMGEADAAIANARKAASAILAGAQVPQ
ncbi:TetR/AcrR family transcriptional regulator [Mesorhizobium sp. M1A.F.Ca.IN.022.07.1.1]|uniref:TetR/AcrR family transcriptional regulator n=1 Tax=unclassified Mesorhizobium TaxID=325217 RepID=UPI000FCBBCF1|nr:MULTISPECIES: TetR/AcrR family transcriptional regulator [unclassified Mesorhizobium]RUV85859.1 TetR/AcrR family transcriptional regulator [Mesorhizobium sp. M1A.F.Ca.IN.022.07.1.1]RUW00117.1 TetR/AcrR family transcriptional regulator [Mesorhizobium sp. M1A.F.Ca.IN.020.03.1.1]RUW02894.1 TetR/AcrR family transcriptional regulator [Mesorhizobium sp. M1A.F.Ca.IN.020.04.1.1]RWF71515.1 MAG: TetR/AcrR family transcriptional regulator [Mesorhizobium sp.]RWG04983.1 MAG: TetR/AcrR family transcripti